MITAPYSYGRCTIMGTRKCLAVSLKTRTNESSHGLFSRKKITSSSLWKYRLIRNLIFGSARRQKRQKKENSKEFFHLILAKKTARSKESGIVDEGLFQRDVFRRYRS